MKSFDFEGPDGIIHTIDGPDDATPEQAFAALQTQLGTSIQQPTQKPLENINWGMQGVTSNDPYGGRATPVPISNPLGKSGENLPLIGGILGSFASPIVGTAAGASIGESAHQIWQRLNQDPNAPQTPLQSLRNQAVETGTQAALAGGAQLATGLIGKGLRAISPSLQEGAKAAQDLFQKYKTSLTVGQVVDEGTKLGGTLSKMEGISRSALFGSGRFKKALLGNEQALQSIRNDLVQNIVSKVPDDATIGQVFIDTVKSGNKALSDTVKPLYSQIDDLAKQSGAAVNMTSVKTMAQNILDRAKETKFAGLSTQQTTLLKDLAAQEPAVSFSGAHDLRSGLLSMVRDMEGTAQPDSRTFGLAKSAAKKITEAMDQSASKAGGDLAHKYDYVSKLYADSSGRLKNEFISKLVQKAPEKVGDTIFQTGNVEAVIQAKAALRRSASLDPSVNYVDGVRKIQVGYLESLLTKNVNAEGETVGSNLLKTLANRKAERTFEAAFNEQQKTSIRAFAKASYLSQTRPESKLGILVNIAQAGALTDMFTVRFNNPETDAAIVLAPWIVARMMTNPRTVNLMVRGFSVGPKTAAGTRIAAQLASEIDSIKQLKQDIENQPMVNQ
jgi:hypothetical protein